MADPQEALKLALTRLGLWTGQTVRFTIGVHTLTGTVEQEPFDTISGGKVFNVVYRGPSIVGSFLNKPVEYHLVLSPQEVEVLQ